MKLISRRTALRGMGVAMSLPLLDAMIPTKAIAAASGQKSSNKPPCRMAFVFIPNGVIVPNFFPKKTGSHYDLPKSLQPLKKVQSHLMVLSGLAADNARAKGDGPGDHARASAAFLTGAHPHKTSGKDIRLGISVDQFAAQRIGQLTYLPSLELGCEKGRQAGRCDSGYSCAYVSNIAWRNETTPVPKEIDPSAVFERLFGSSDERNNTQARQQRMSRRQSILDFVAEDAKTLNKKLGLHDQQKMDEFLTSVREIEQRIERAKNEQTAQVLPTDQKQPQGIPRSYKQHVRLMYDMLALSFQMDRTRIGTFMSTLAGSNRSYREVGVPEGHHHLSHHRNDPKKVAAIQKIDQFHIEQYAYFIEKLLSIPEGNGSLLDSCMIMLGSGICDGNRHSHNDLPILLAGSGGGTINSGRHVRYRRDTPICNLYLEMLARMDIKTKSFGDSTGGLKQLTI